MLIGNRDTINYRNDYRHDSDLSELSIRHKTLLASYAFISEFVGWIGNGEEIRSGDVAKLKRRYFFFSVPFIIFALLFLSPC